MSVRVNMTCLHRVDAVGWQQDGYPDCKQVVVCWHEMQTTMPLPLIVSCFSKIQIGFTFLVSAHLDNPRKRAGKCACVRVTYIAGVATLCNLTYECNKLYSL